MTQWKVKIKGLRELLSSDNSDENAIKVGKQIYKLLTRKSYNKYFVDFALLEDFNYIINVEDLNHLLNDMYDYCDEQRIWVA